MSNDIQIFLIAPPLLFLYIKNRTSGLLLTWLLLILCLITSYVICDLNEYHFAYAVPGAKPQPDYMTEYYDKPWVRAAPYIMGMLVGYWYRDWKF